MSETTNITHLADVSADSFTAVRPSGERRQTVMDRNTVAGVMHAVGECVYQWDIVDDVLSWSEGAAALFCLSDIAQIESNRAFSKLMLPTTKTSREEITQQVIEEDTGEGVPYRFQYALCGQKIGTGSNIWLEDSGRCFADETGNAVRAQGVIRIVNERRSLEERLDRMSKFDSLTGLYNRSHLEITLQNLLSRALPSGESHAFMVVGIDHFDLINSVYGFEAADGVIIEVARRLKENVRKIDILGRFSGARLGIVMEDCDERSLLIAGHRVLNLIKDELVKTERGSIAVTAAVGGVIIPKHATTPRAAFNAAHHALLEARKERESNISVYQPDPSRDAEQRQSVEMAERIVQALKQGRVHLVYQPVVNAKSEEIEFFEALIRLEDQDGLELAAGDFVSVAEKLGLIRLIDHYALDQAIETLKTYPSAKLSLNVSNETATDPEWLSKLAIAALHQPDIAPRLIVEITESHAAHSLEEAGRFIESLHDLGFKVALDDFGAGFTSFRNLRTLNFDVIKVDGLFATDLDANPQNAGFIKALVGLAQLFEAKTVVEWVEDAESAIKLRDWGVDFLQGYKYGRPLRQPHWPDGKMQDLFKSA